MACFPSFVGAVELVTGKKSPEAIIHDVQRISKAIERGWGHVRRTKLMFIFYMYPGFYKQLG